MKTFAFKAALTFITVATLSTGYAASYEMRVPSTGMTSPLCSLPWGGTIEVSTSVTAYQAAVASYGGSCISETRTCVRGTLSGSYLYATCTDPAARADIVYSTPGTYTWTVPTGVTSFSAVAVGGGGYGGGGGGGGGALAYVNNVSVTPGQQITIVVGAGGTSAANATGSSVGNYITAGPGGSGAACWALHTGTAGSGGTGSGIAGSVTYSGGSGAACPGYGSWAQPGGGGGAAGYAGIGGLGGTTGAAGGAGTGGAGGGGGGGYGSSSGSGGGVGLYGQGTSGAGGAYKTGMYSGWTGDAGGLGGSGGANGGLSLPGGAYGGGGTYGSVGGSGAVRIVWGYKNGVLPSYPNPANVGL